MAMPSNSNLIPSLIAQSALKKEDDTVLPITANKWYQQMDKMIGEKKDYKTIFSPPLGIPYPERSPEELRIAAAMESCMFKTTMSCVIGLIIMLLTSNFSNIYEIIILQL